MKLTGMNPRTIIKSRRFGRYNGVRNDHRMNLFISSHYLTTGKAENAYP